MGSFENIAQRLPSIYRPESRGGEELSKFIGASSDLIDLANEEISAILQTHWFRYADSALYSPWFGGLLKLQKKVLPPPSDPAVQSFPYICDLGRLAALFGILPWQEGASYSEGVEAFRKRIGRMVKLFRNGLGTLVALRTIVEASLPLHEDSGLSLVDLPFTVEEFPHVTVQRQKAAVLGTPNEILGPLMRWTVTNGAPDPIPVTVYIGGTAPEDRKTAPTQAPCIELYKGNGVRYPVALAFNGTVPPGKTLRIRPAYSSFSGNADGVFTASSAPSGDLPATPVPLSQWSRMEPGPETSVVALCLSADRKLYAASIDGSGTSGRLWVYDGSQWMRLDQAFPPIYDLIEEGDHLLIATASGMKSFKLHAAGDDGRVGDIPLGETLPVYTVRSCKGAIWIGTSKGAWQLERGLPRKKLVPFAHVYAIGEDNRGVMFFGSDAGLFQFYPSSNRCFLFRGGEHSETEPEWVTVDQETPSPPSSAKKLFIPDVSSVLRSSDGWLWIGTRAGIARWGALTVAGKYTTRLAAFPLLGTGNVFEIREDERGRVWFCTEKGLIVHDGRDFYQMRDGECVRLAAADDSQARQLAGEEIWRYERDTSAWSRHDNRSDQWCGEDGKRLAKDEKSVYGIAWCDGLSADLGVWDGTSFASEQTVGPSLFTTRFKVNHRRIVNGGIPALPRLPHGASVWRLLRKESGAEVVPTTDRRWSCEGRQLFGDRDLRDPRPARFQSGYPPPAIFENMVHAFLPSARIEMEWREPSSCSVLVRLAPGHDEAIVDSVVVDRVWQALNFVRPAGIRVLLAINETIVRGA